MKKKNILSRLKKVSVSFAFLFSSFSTFAQTTNVYDDIIATSPNHTSLLAAINTAGLQSALKNPTATLTVFAPTNAAFDSLAVKLNTNIAGLLALPNLSDILLYHVLGVTANAASITNGQVVQPLNNDNSIKLTKTALGKVYANHALVTTADLTATNGVVHVVDAVILSDKTVVDIALGSASHTSLVAALVKAELLPALTNPFSKFTVFAPTNNAFDALATELNTNIAGLLALPNLSDILLYHVLGATANAASITNGQIVQPLDTTNSIKLTKTTLGKVYANHALVTAADLTATNGVVHVVDAVILSDKTVVDIALGSASHTSLVAALVKAELLPALTNPFSKFTVFAPTNAAFDSLAVKLNTNIAGLLALPNLSDILLYHVAGVEKLAASLSNGSITMLNNETVVINITNGVMVNSSKVTTADLTASNGVVHIIDKVLTNTSTSINESLEMDLIAIYPNPASNFITIKGTDDKFASVSIIDAQGKNVFNSSLNNESTTLDIQNLSKGHYTVILQGSNSIITKSFLITSNN